MMILAILVFVIDVVAVLHVFRSRGPVAVKAEWIVGIVLFPVVGALAWLLSGPRDRHQSTAW